MKEVLLYLRDGVLWGLDGDREVEAPLEEFPLMRRRAVLMMEDEGLWYKVLTLPPSPHLDLKRLTEHEARESLERPEDYVLRGRVVGEREGAAVYLIVALKRERIAEVMDALEAKGIHVSKVISPLDLFLERGKGWVEGRSCCLLLIDGQEVTILLYAKGEFVFWREFKLATPVEDPQVADELATELRRSALYLLQEYKVRAEVGIVVSPPRWLTEEVAADVAAKSGLRVERVPLAERSSPWLALMEEARDLIPRLPSLIPMDVRVASFLGRRRVAVTLLALLLSVFSLSWAGLKALEYRALEGVLEQSRRVIEMWQPILEKRRERLEELQRLKASREGLFRMLKERSAVRFPLEALGYLVPRGAFLKKVVWRRDQGGEQMELEIEVEHEDLERRYTLYQRLIDDLRGAPFVEEVRPEPSKLLTEGVFSLTVVLKEIGDGA